MAGSLNHMAREDGHMSLSHMDNGGDMIEALYDCWNVIVELSGGDRDKVNKALRKINSPELASAPKQLLLTDWEEAYPPTAFHGRGYRSKKGS